MKESIHEPWLLCSSVKGPPHKQIMFSLSCRAKYSNKDIPHFHKEQECMNEEFKINYEATHEESKCKKIKTEGEKVEVQNVLQSKDGFLHNILKHSETDTPNFFHKKEHHLSTSKINKVLENPSNKKSKLKVLKQEEKNFKKNHEPRNETTKSEKVKTENEVAKVLNMMLSKNDHSHKPKSSGTNNSNHFLNKEHPLSAGKMNKVLENPLNKNYKLKIPEQKGKNFEKKHESRNEGTKSKKIKTENEKVKAQKVLQTKNGLSHKPKHLETNTSNYFHNKEHPLSSDKTDKTLENPYNKKSTFNIPEQNENNFKKNHESRNEATKSKKFKTEYEEGKVLNMMLSENGHSHKPENLGTINSNYFLNKQHPLSPGKINRVLQNPSNKKSKLKIPEQNEKNFKKDHESRNKAAKSKKIKTKNEEVKVQNVLQSKNDLLHNPKHLKTNTSNYFHNKAHPLLAGKINKVLENPSNKKSTPKTPEQMKKKFKKNYESRNEVPKSKTIRTENKEAKVQNMMLSRNGNQNKPKHLETNTLNNFHNKEHPLSSDKTNKILEKPSNRKNTLQIPEQKEKHVKKKHESRNEVTKSKKIKTENEEAKVQNMIPLKNSHLHKPKQSETNTSNYFHTKQHPHSSGKINKILENYSNKKSTSIIPERKEHNLKNNYESRNEVPNSKKIVIKESEEAKVQNIMVSKIGHQNKPKHSETNTLQYFNNKMLALSSSKMIEGLKNPSNKKRVPKFLEEKGKKIKINYESKNEELKSKKDKTVDEKVDVQNVLQSKNGHLHKLKHSETNTIQYLNNKILALSSSKMIEGLKNPSNNKKSPKFLEEKEKRIKKNYESKNEEPKCKKVKTEDKKVDVQNVLQSKNSLSHKPKQSETNASNYFHNKEHPLSSGKINKILENPTTKKSSLNVPEKKEKQLKKNHESRNEEPKCKKIKTEDEEVEVQNIWLLKNGHSHKPKHSEKNTLKYVHNEKLAFSSGKMNEGHNNFSNKKSTPEIPEQMVKKLKKNYESSNEVPKSKKIKTESEEAKVQNMMLSKTGQQHKPKHSETNTLQYFNKKELALSSGKINEGLENTSNKKNKLNISEEKEQNFKKKYESKNEEPKCEKIKSADEEINAQNMMLSKDSHSYKCNYSETNTLKYVHNKKLALLSGKMNEGLKNPSNKKNELKILEEKEKKIKINNESKNKEPKCKKIKTENKKIDFQNMMLSKNGLLQKPKHSETNTLKYVHNKEHAFSSGKINKVLENPSNKNSLSINRECLDRKCKRKYNIENEEPKLNKIKTEDEEVEFRKEKISKKYRSKYSKYSNKNFRISSSKINKGFKNPLNKNSTLKKNSFDKKKIIAKQKYDLSPLKNYIITLLGVKIRVRDANNMINTNFKLMNKEIIEAVKNSYYNSIFSSLGTNEPTLQRFKLLHKKYFSMYVQDTIVIINNLIFMNWLTNTHFISLTNYIISSVKDTHQMSQQILFQSVLHIKYVKILDNVVKKHCVDIISNFEDSDYEHGVLMLILTLFVNLKWFGVFNDSCIVLKKIERLQWESVEQHNFDPDRIQKTLKSDVFCSCYNELSKFIGENSYTDPSVVNWWELFCTPSLSKSKYFSSAIGAITSALDADKVVSLINDATNNLRIHPKLKDGQSTSMYRRNKFTKLNALINDFAQEHNGNNKIAQPCTSSASTTSTSEFDTLNRIYQN